MKRVFIFLTCLAILPQMYAYCNGCPENQHYESCGTACPLTCENYRNPPVACIFMCNPGCHCDEGYVKTEEGSCVKPEQCPSNAEERCRENQEYTTCGTACPLTCENYQNPPKICNLMCVIGCQCKEGYVLDRDGECVLPENCPPKDCRSEPDSGLCRAYIPMYYYNPETASCEEFIYGGCGGNGNRYSSEDQCMKQCFGVRQELDRPDCDKPAETGPCKAGKRRFYYDQELGMCKTFIYGGCGGNRNNFRTEFECYNKCGALASRDNSFCVEDAEVGPCRARIPRYFFNRETGQCEQFFYGGCRGNRNNFVSKSQCEASCSP